MPRTLSVLALCVSLSLPAAALAQAVPRLGPSELEPASTGGLETIDRALQRIGQHRRLLVIGAHPDDEDTTLLTQVGRGMGGEAAYLSLTRGEGGQNLIGPELGLGLGLLRTGELLAARSVDGGRQFFTRAYDFGYTRSLEETLTRWPREELLRDVVRVVRRFRPQVIVSVFPPDARAGHGQHQAAGVLAGEAFAAAGDPERFPELAGEGLAPWTPRTLYRAAWWDPEAATLELPADGLEPFSGRSIGQLAMASRSQHRSQDMGTLQEPGPRANRLAWEAGGGGPEGEGLFAGVDTRLEALADDLPAELPAEQADEVRAELAGIGADARAARASLTASHPAAAAPALASIADRLARLEASLGQAGAAAAPVVAIVAEKRLLAERGLLAAAGVVVDATTERATAAPGDELTVTLKVWSGGGVPVGLRGARIEGIAEAEAGGPVQVEAGRMETRDVVVALPHDAPATIPYFLREPLEGDLYDWADVGPARRGEPFGPPALSAVFELAVEGHPLTLSRAVVHRQRDQAVGEVRRPFRVVPEVEVEVSPELVLWPASREGGSAETPRIEVSVRSNVPRAVVGRLEIGGGGSSDVALPLGLEPGELQVHRLPVGRRPSPGVHERTVAAVTADGRFAGSTSWVSYPHIVPSALPRRAEVKLSVFDLELPAARRIGFIVGASEAVPELLARVGLPIERLGAHELLQGDLDGLDVIVVGSRAYETEPAVSEATPRLLGWVEAGGTLIVEYQQYAFVRGAFAPFDLEIARPHDRVTDETAPVRLLAPGHPVFRHPNRIGPEDWEGWVQERGLYFAHTWGDELTPLLALADSGGEELAGGLLVGRLGDGVWAYTGLAFFRQLPAGVPGAYRLFANLLALGERPLPPSEAAGVSPQADEGDDG